MMKKTWMCIAAIMLLVAPAFSAEPAVDFDQGVDVVQTIQLSKENSTNQSIQPQSQFPAAIEKAVKSEPAKIQTLSDLIRKCPQGNQIKFYKSLFFVNGRLASMNTESVKEYLNKDELATLMNMLVSKSKDEQCLCNVFHRLNCSSWSNASCDSSVCFGTCNVSRSSSKLKAGYIDMADMFLEVPQETAREFIGGFVLNNGQIEGYYYGGITKYLGMDKTKGILEILTHN